MIKVVVAGIVSVRIALPVPTFPVPFVASNTRTGAINVRLSGTGWTVARTLQQLGTAVSLATYVGADALGRLADHGLRGCELYGPATQVCDAHPRSVELYDGDGHKASTRDPRSATDLPYPEAVFASVLDARPPCDFAVLTHAAFTRRLIPTVVARGVPFATDLRLDDPQHRDWLSAAQMVACSQDQLTEQPESWIRQVWQRFGTEIALVGCGTGGAVLGLRASRRIWRVDASTPRRARYCSRAGGTLLASFVHHYLTLCDPVAAARHAVLTAGWKFGATPAEPSGVAADILASIKAEHGLPQAHLVA
jgi:sugar/nucleoside kinase (ribokinase family)